MRGASPESDGPAARRFRLNKPPGEQDGRRRGGDGEPSRRVAVVQPAQLQPARPGRPLRSALGRSALPLFGDLVSNTALTVSILPDDAA